MPRSKQLPKKPEDNILESGTLPEKIMACAACGMSESSTLEFLGITKAQFEEHYELYKNYKGKLTEIARWAMTKNAMSGDIRAAQFILKTEGSSDMEQDERDEFQDALIRTVERMLDSAQKRASMQGITTEQTSNEKLE